MSSDSSDSGDHTKVYKLKSRKNFPAWKQKTLSLASSKGHERFLLKTVKVPTEDEVNGKEQDYIQETDKAKAKQYKKGARTHEKGKEEESRSSSDANWIRKDKGFKNAEKVQK